MSASKLPPFEYYEPATIAEASAILTAHGADARVLAGGVDLLPRMRVGSVKAGHLVNIQRVAGLDYARRTATGGIEFGAMASLHSLERWNELASGYPALYDAMHQITSVQTKCMGTAVGNLCVATPASDIAPALAAYEAELLISGPGGNRRVAMVDFYPAYGRTALGLGEFVTGVEVPPVPAGHGAAFKNLVRTHADIAKVTVTAAVVLGDGLCKQARIALGSVAPTMFRARRAEALLEGTVLTDERILSAAAAAAADATPIDDIRSSAEYRKATAEVLVGRALHKAGELARGVEMIKQVLTFNVNGLPYDAIVTPNLTLADLLREELGLTGAKESCQVGECGACTVLVDGRPFLSCSTLAIAVRDKEIITIEGLADTAGRGPGVLHPIQQAFIDNGAIQCGFCSPGMILMAKALLSENPRPTRLEVQEWLGGNLCRCTGYVKIVDAVLAAADALRKEAGE